MSESHDPLQAAESVEKAALELGFTRVGFAPAERMDLAARRFEAWLGAGYHGSMHYLEGEPDRADPRALLPEAKTLIVVALEYRPPAVAPQAASEAAPLLGRVAAYASGADYHELLKGKLRELSVRVAEIVGRPVAARVCVDTAPLLERAAAERSGVGFSGKSTLLISPGAGSYLVLGELLVDVELAASPPELPGCGSCRACLDACPTGAFVSEHVLDARRCIAYLTIEHVGSIPRELRPLLGDRVFGCDDCQSVCPYNAGANRRALVADPRAAQESSGLNLLELLEIGSKPYRRLVQARALGRVSRARMARNAAIALGNLKDPRAVPALARRARGDSHALVREHAAWALGQIGGEDAHRALKEARDHDPHEGVREEARRALIALEQPMIEEVLEFWFSDPARWWKKDPASDAEIRARFAALHAEIEAGEHEAWFSSPRGALAYVIVLDQFSRNMFRDTARMFAADARALSAAAIAIDQGHDARLNEAERGFLYMPFMHSEDRSAQARSIELFSTLSSKQMLGYAERHRDIVERFGRFPHRNALLGRASSAEELEFLKTPGASF